MEQLRNLMLPEESQIDQGNYFQSLLAAAMEMKLLSDTELSGLQYSLAGLLAKQTERYTSGESSSVTIERAQSLLQGICYHISIYLKSFPTMEQKLRLLKEEKPEVLHRKGMEVVSELYHEAERKLKLLQATSPLIDNQAYQDTLYHGLPEFFHDYELEFAPQESAGTIDYPLCLEISDSTGVEYILTYLKRLEEENHFISRFPKEQVADLLKGFHRDSRELLVNIYELALTNALGTILTGKKELGLAVEAVDREWLQLKLQGKSREELGKRLTAAYEELTHSLGYEEKLPGYGVKCTMQLIERLYQSLELHTLEQIFISLPVKREYSGPAGTSGAAYEATGNSDIEAMGYESSDTEAMESGSIFYEEGARRKDEELRELIDELNTKSSTMEKLLVIKRSVHSLDDLTELLPICFDREEYEEVYRLLSDTELKILLQRSEEEDNPYRSREEQAEWQIYLVDYYNRRMNSQ